MGRKLFTFAVSAFFFYVASPLVLPVAMGALFAVLLLPLQEWLEKHKFRTSLASILLTVSITLLLILPISFTVYTGAKMGFQQLQSVKDSAHGNWTQTLMSSPFAHRMMALVREWYPIGQAELTDTLQDLARGLSVRAADWLGALISFLPGMVIGLLIVVVSIYFMLVDGRRLVLFFRHNSFFSPQQTDRLVGTLEATCRSVLLASLVSGSLQAVFEAVIAALVGLPNVALVTVLVFISSFIPVVGTGPVTFGLSAQQFISGNQTAGFVLLGAAIVVTSMDNVIRPWFLRGSVNLHPLLAFVAAFGGLQTLGVVGVFLGPIIAALFVVTIQILSQDGPSNSRSDH